MALILDGKKYATEIEADLSLRVKTLVNKGHAPALATILVGDDPASHTYVKMKGSACTRVGLVSRGIHLPAETTTEELLQTIDELNADPAVRGIMLQHPAPKHIDERRCFDRISLEKDVDGLTCHGFGRMAMGESAFGAATPAGIMALLSHYEIPLAGKDAVVIGRSPILGKPLAMMLLAQNATVTICHSKTEGLAEKVAAADIVVGAVGIPRFIQADWISSGAVVIDAGYHPAEKCGDIDLEGCRERVSAYTPVPGGVGPMTIMTLMRQAVESAERFWA
ncbi:bifunctional 5,10-methylenetetrahydrofolate dehydrogenase/5,10-methenyltetrahydrofolate cyclohydrolase [Chitinivibrio alkaliphilus]|uniref:Bifunctional protein FolD n=1 Tax=Chitinivibrio alkaliphilus ACht1 TaxID=1313304 RepID=U7D4Q9_9BACT|nr:bifunctional 5,10-methylene-tetrahydrofolate dehydrogenase/5,10-methylene-tetrahydrofolate cyclohydrolase [Chitinivibrio alkaliphilus]ERP30923.1 bifunctional 5,10-methylene-tetrahydrofolate dehydrogenase/ 5,10-methylene-tetrahydrofolate cyclohydrolase [Chitinivibrio alkaliphilus ACht1]